MAVKPSLPGRKAMILAGLILLALLAAIGVSRALSKKTDPAHDDNPSAADALPPNTFRPTKMQWDSLHIEPVSVRNFHSEEVTDGAIATNDTTTVNVFSPYSGRVAAVNAKVGDMVRKGDALMTVEATEFVQVQNDLVTAEAALNTANVQLNQAKKNENRQHELYLAKAGALKDWQQSQADLASAQNNVRTAGIALAAVRNRMRILGKSDKDILALETKPDAQKMASAAVVVAPINGTVVQRQLGPGQYIQSASAGAANPVFSIADLSTVWLVANLRESDVGRIRVGQEVEVRVPAYPDRVFKAKVNFISPVVDANTHRVPVRAQIDNRDGALKPAMLASFRILTGTVSMVPSVPQSAVVYEGSDARVFVARSDGLIEARSIRVGRQNGEMIEVVSGLAADEKLVTSGALFIDRVTKGAQG
jgi:cobalt-zinc-cadmium efflux system membrane fusion protein